MTGATPFITAVLGIDGSGKSTLSRRLATESSVTGRVAFIGDRAEVIERGRAVDLGVQLTEHLRRRISERAKEAVSLDRYRIPKIAELVLRDRLLDEVLTEYRPAMVFMDGMPALNMAAWTVLYAQSATLPVAATCGAVLDLLTGRGEPSAADDPVFARFPELARLRALGFDHFHLPDAVIFLDVPPEVCVARITGRGKPLQAHETASQLALLRSAYVSLCGVLEDSPLFAVARIDGDRDAGAVAWEARRFVETAREARNGQ